MTTPTPADYAAAKEIRKCVSWLDEANTFMLFDLERTARLIAAHRAMPPDWDEMEIANAGAAGLARALLNDTGHGEMTPGPCADALALIRELRAKVSDPAVAHAADLKAMLSRIMPYIYERGMTGESDWERLILGAHALLAKIENERKASQKA